MTTQTITPNFPVPVGADTDSAQMINTRGGRVNPDGATYGEVHATLGYRPHGDGGPDRRGSNAARKIRKLKILGALPIKRGPRFTWGGNGKTVPCVHCGESLTYVTMQVDRKDPYGTYELSNVQASCHRCNTARADDVNWTYDPQIHPWGPRYSALMDAKRGITANGS